jgi:hypothetical protein
VRRNDSNTGLDDEEEDIEQFKGFAGQGGAAATTTTTVSSSAAVVTVSAAGTDTDADTSGRGAADPDPVAEAAAAAAAAASANSAALKRAEIRKLYDGSVPPWDADAATSAAAAARGGSGMLGLDLPEHQEDSHDHGDRIDVHASWRQQAEAGQYSVEAQLGQDGPVGGNEYGEELPRSLERGRAADRNLPALRMAYAVLVKVLAYAQEYCRDDFDPLQLWMPLLADSIRLLSSSRIDTPAWCQQHNIDFTDAIAAAAAAKAAAEIAARAVAELEEGVMQTVHSFLDDKHAHMKKKKKAAALQPAPGEAVVAVATADASEAPSRGSGGGSELQQGSEHTQEGGGGREENGEREGGDPSTSSSSSSSSSSAAAASKRAREAAELEERRRCEDPVLGHIARHNRDTKIVTDLSEELGTATGLDVLLDKHQQARQANNREYKVQFHHTIGADGRGHGPGSHYKN